MTVYNKWLLTKLVYKSLIPTSSLTIHFIEFIICLLESWFFLDENQILHLHS